MGTTADEEGPGEEGDSEALSFESLTHLPHGHIVSSEALSVPRNGKNSVRAIT